mmetsp:Transcript_12040/g.30905  ORF Transcript_12040/g.30905 Transcript_12040/m.30905 type:complete len:209 (-) Transcript_12040:845-1471(-)
MTTIAPIAPAACNVCAVSASSWEPGNAGLRENGRPVAASGSDTMQKSRTALTVSDLRKRRCTRCPSGRRMAMRFPSGLPGSGSAGRSARALAMISSALAEVSASGWAPASGAAVPLGPAPSAWASAMDSAIARAISSSSVIGLDGAARGCDGFFLIVVSLGPPSSGVEFRNGSSFSSSCSGLRYPCHCARQAPVMGSTTMIAGNCTSL